MIKLNRIATSLFYFFISCCTLISPAQSAEVMGVGEFCFRIRNAENNNPERLLRLEITYGGLQSYGLIGVIQDLNEAEQPRYWINGSSRKLSGNTDVGIDAWFSGHLTGVENIKSGSNQYRATFTHALPFATSLSEYTDSISNSSQKMALANCTDEEFQELYENENEG